MRNNGMKGKLIGLGVGPGDPELLTLKALRIVKESDVIAVPGNIVKESVAYQIVKEVYPELDEKTLLPVRMPMTKDPQILEQNHKKAADDVEGWLEKGVNVAFLTLGDPTVYSTYMYVHKRIMQRGYETEIVSGITSFCAVAAKMNMSLAEMAEPLHVIPATYHTEHMEDILELSGTKVLMKSGKKLKQVKESILRSGQPAVMIQDCGMDTEKIYNSVEEMPEEAGYYSLVIVKEKKKI